MNFQINLSTDLIQKKSLNKATCGKMINLIRLYNHHLSNHPKNDEQNLLGTEKDFISNLIL